jgi:hypothetical protein
MTEETRKATFAWASIAGADPEPVELVEENGRKGVFTTGCIDPFWLDDPDAGVVLYVNPLVRPENPETQEQRDARDAAYRARKAEDHRWRGPR